MEKIKKRLSGALGKDRVFTDHLTLVAAAADGGCYRKIPRIVLRPHTEGEVTGALRILHEEAVPVTFRAAGTSLSGQAISDSVLLEARGDRWSTTEVLEKGAKIRTQPGITGARLNRILAPYGRKFGPDPASVNSAMVGGIIANNAAGMSCGIHANSYATIRSARIVFADGTLLDTADTASREAFCRQRKELVRTVGEIRDRIRAREELSGRIAEKYRIKNTMGYGLNAFLDYDDPVDIILHLMVGSEGTLGFVSEATFRTIPVKPYRASSLIYFHDLETACRAVPGLREAGVPAIEIMDREALRSVEDNPDIPAYIKEFGKGVTALLIDLEAESEEALEVLISATRNALSGFGLARDFEITGDPKRIAALWNVRKGVFPAVGGMRKPGTSVIIEDVAVQMDHLTGAVTGLRGLLDELGYRDAVIYGHVLDGNLHFIFAQDFSDPGEVRTYHKLIVRLTELIVDKYNGSLKAEHGTGLNMAPFVATEWGGELHGMMKEIKQAFDPKGILNPDVIVTGDPELHLKHFKQMPEIHESVDTCIECGFCEINCLSTGFTLSARQRIVVQREIAMLTASGQDPQRRTSLERSFRYAGDATCAGDGLCAVSCPLSIDTGILIKQLRATEKSKKRGARLVASAVANRFRMTHRLMRSGLRTMNAVHRITGAKPLAWDRHVPRPVRPAEIPEPTAGNSELQVVYFPSCINQSMGPSAGGPNGEPLVRVTVEVLEKAGYKVMYPEKMRSLCCGMPWESKGFTGVADARSAELETALIKASDGGRIPVLCDNSPCTCRMKESLTRALSIYEPVEFIHDFLLEILDPAPLEKSAAFHITCTSTKMGIEEKFRKVAARLVKEPLFPEEVGCCGFAGDKGFTRPELNSWSLRRLAPQVADSGSGYSNSRTCEIGLSRHGGIDYSSVMFLLHEAVGVKTGVVSEDQ